MGGSESDKTRNVVPQPDNGESGLLRELTPQEHIEQLDELGSRFTYGCYHYKNPLSCHSLGQWFAGWGKQPAKALAAYKYACDEYNFGPSCLSYGTALLFGNAELPRGMRNLGATKDVLGAYRAFEHGCTKGGDEVGRCCMALAEMKVKGYGSHRPQLEEGLQLFEETCYKHKFPKACHALGGMYLKSNTKKMEQLWEHACRSKEWSACKDLSVLYSEGVDGVAPNPELAERYKRIYHRRTFEEAN